jgi:hypothetical protein
MDACNDVVWDELLRGKWLGGILSIIQRGRGAHGPTGGASLGPNWAMARPGFLQKNINTYASMAQPSKTHWPSLMLLPVSRSWSFLCAISINHGVASLSRGTWTTWRGHRGEVVEQRRIATSRHRRQLGFAAPADRRHGATATSHGHRAGRTSRLLATDVGGCNRSSYLLQSPCLGNLLSLLAIYSIYCSFTKLGICFSILQIATAKSNSHLGSDGKKHSEKN